MSPRVFETLEQAGFSAVELSAKVELFRRVTEALADAFGRHPEVAFWIPGRLEVFGKHTDYAGGRTLISTVPRGFAMVAARRDDDRIQLLDVKSGERAFIDVRTGERSPFGWARYVALIASRFARNFPGVSLGMDLALLSDLPRAAGASSSSALTVGAAMSMVRLGAIDERPEWRDTIDSPLALAGYLSCLENGLTFGTLEGGGGVGTHSGSEDHTAMVCAKPGQMSAYSFVPVRHLEDVRVPDDWSFIVASSGVPAEKAGAAQALYNRASLGARALLDVWNSEHAWRPSLAEALRTRPDAAAVLRAMLTEATLEGRPFPWTVADLNRRLSHFVAEDSRIPEAVAAARDADAVRMGALAKASQQDADLLLGNQIEETRALSMLATEQGAFAASAFGAGFGGSVWALCPRADAEAFGARWMRAYLARHPNRTSATWFVSSAAPAMLEISL